MTFKKYISVALLPCTLCLLPGPPTSQVAGFQTPLIIQRAGGAKSSTLSFLQKKSTFTVFLGGEKSKHSMGKRQLPMPEREWHLT